MHGCIEKDINCLSFSNAEIFIYSKGIHFSMRIIDFLKDEKAQSEFSSLYMLIVLVIAALLIITLVKPMFRQSQKIVSKTVK